MSISSAIPEARSIRWGIAGTGGIAATFAEGLTFVPDAELAAVGSRTAAAAADFARRVGATGARTHGSYAALAADPEVDVVYVAAPHPMHYPIARLSLEVGKPVLCEKPFTVNAAEARDLVDLAGARGLFLMEGMWTRLLPAMIEVRETIAAGAIGEVQALVADFGFRKERDPRHRLYDPALGGGALLDIGIYLVALASSFFGSPAEIGSAAQIGPTGVDESAALLLRYPGARFAQLAATIVAETPQQATILGSTGVLRIHGPWWRTKRFTVERDGAVAVTVERAYPGHGFQFEAAEVGRCLRADLRESPAMPLAETVAIAETLDRVRAQWGLRYPGED